MKWKKFTIETTTQAVDLISSILGELGVEGIEIDDYVPLTEEEVKEMFIDILPELPDDDGSARVTFYLDYDMDCRELLVQIARELEELKTYCEAGSCRITADETEDIDWINNWKAFFKPFAIDDILIKPAWEPVPAEHADKLCVEMDPGTAFGSGSHETTQLCIRGIDRYLEKGMRVLDIGTGSGILGIVAMKRGAGSVTATDVDPQAVLAACENRERNGISPECFEIFQGNLLEDEKARLRAGEACYDLVVANILAPVIIALTAEAGRHMKSGAVFITSGIINTKEAEVVAAFGASEDFDVLAVDRQGDWVAVYAVRR